MAKILLLAFSSFAAISIAFGAGGDGWSYYVGSSDGPAKWGGICESGIAQTPIDIISESAEYDPSLGEIYMTNYGRMPSENFTYTNTNRTLKVSFPENFYFVSGGGLPGHYATVQFHLHWGSDDTKGSEHAVDGMLYPAELHFVSYNTKYANIGAALDHADGLAVLGVFLTVGSESASPFFSAFPPLDLPADQGKKALPFLFNTLLPSNKSSYYRYAGSLTTPPCSEAVTWTVFKDSIQLSREQMNAFRQLKMDNNDTIVNNYRPLQLLNGRMVKSSFMTKPPTVSSSTPLKITNFYSLLMTLYALFLL